MANKFSKHYSSTSKGAYSISKGISDKEILEIKDDIFLNCIVLEENLKVEEYKSLEKHIFSQKINVLLSIYRDFSENLSMKFLQSIPSLKKLRLTNFSSFSDFEDVEIMSDIEDLSIERCDIEFFEILKIMPTNITKLSLGSLKAKKLNIDFISRFEKLESLYVEGHSKGIEAIGRLINLKELTLRSISHPSLYFLKDLNHLTSLDIKLGTVKDFSILPKMTNIKYLELWYIKGLTDISFISEMKELQSLHLESLSNITTLPNFDTMQKFRRIRLMNMNGLSDFSSLKTAPKLQDFFFTIINKQLPEDIIPVLENPTLINMYVYFPSEKKNKLFQSLVLKCGKEYNENWPNFEFE